MKPIAPVDVLAPPLYNRADLRHKPRLPLPPTARPERPRSLAGIAAVIALASCSLCLPALASPVPSNFLTTSPTECRASCPAPSSVAPAQQEEVKPTTAPPPDGQRIAKINIVGNKVLNTTAILTIAGHKVGDRCTPLILSEMRDRLAASGNFGMHHPEKAVQVQAEAIPGYECIVTITVDENDEVKGMVVSGSGPIKIEDVKALITQTPVFNSQTFERDKRAIEMLCNLRGYSYSFDKSVGMDPKNPGTLLIPIVLLRVRNIEIKKDGVKISDAGMLARIATKPGDYLKRKIFYEQDRQKLSRKDYYDVTCSEKWVSQGLVDLDISIRTTKPKQD